MESKDLRFFLEVSKTNSISKAADNLYSSQSNVSAHIKKIENELNIKLLYRTNKGVFLTKEGEKLLIYAENIVSLVNEANNLFLTKKENFIIGTTQTLSLTLPGRINFLQQKFPNTLISTKLLNNTFQNKKNQFDCIITNSSNTAYSMYKVFEFFEQLVIITPKTCQNIEDIFNYTIIVNNLPSCPYRNLLLKYIVTKNKETPNIIEMDSINGIIDLIELGSGISLVPKHLVKNEMKINQFYIKEISNVQINIWLKEKNTKFGEALIKTYQKKFDNTLL